MLRQTSKVFVCRGQGNSVEILLNIGSCGRWLWNLFKAVRDDLVNSTRFSSPGTLKQSH